MIILSVGQLVSNYLGTIEFSSDGFAVKDQKQYVVEACSNDRQISDFRT